MNHLRYLLSAAAMAFALPQSGHAEQLVPYQQFTLSNGLRVIVHEDHKTPKVAVSVWYHVGSANEPDGKSGFAHLYEHLMFNGSENHNREYFPPLQEIGASGVNGATSLDQTYYYEIIPTGGLDRALWLESDRMGHLLGAITQAKLDEQRAVVKNEKRMREGQPYALMHQRKSEAVFPQGHPYHHSVIGSMEDLDAASLEDVKNWFRQHYGAANAVVTLSGDVTLAQAKAMMQKYFGNVPSGPPTSRVTAWVPTLEHDKFEVMQDDVPQTAISRNWAVPGRNSADASGLRMAALVLGRGKTSRLYRALVHDKQIATSVSASYDSFAVAGMFSIDAQLKQGVDRAQAEAAIDEVLREFLKAGPTEAEVKQAKTTSYGDTARALESIYVRAMALTDGAMFANNPHDFLDNENRFAAVSAAGARNAAANWLKKGSYRLAVLPFGTHSAGTDTADRAKIPVLGPSPELALPAKREATLSNGIRVVLSERPGTPTLEMVMVFDAGQAAEQHMKKGLGSFMLGLMDEGTRTLDTKAYADRQAMLGARIYAFGDSDTTDFGLSALTRTLPESISLWADYIRNPGFRPQDLERDRALTLSALTQAKSNPDEISQRAFNHLIFGEKHAYGVSMAGREETLKSYTREDVVAFHESWIRPDNAVIYASGSTTLPELVTALEKAIGDWKAPARPKGVKSLDPASDSQATRIVLIDKPGALQSVIRVGQLMPSGLDPREFGIDAMSDVLGGGFTARLNMNLREDKGWTYGASSFIASARGPQVFGVSTSIQTDKTSEAMSEIDGEIRALQGKRPATVAEIDLLSKGKVLALPGHFETNQAVVTYFRQNNRFDRPYDYITTLPAKYAGLRPEAITATANELLRPDAMTWVVVGDLAKIEPKIRSLKLGPVEVWNAEGKRLR